MNFPSSLQNHQGLTYHHHHLAPSSPPLPTDLGLSAPVWACFPTLVTPRSFVSALWRESHCLWIPEGTPTQKDLTC